MPRIQSPSSINTFKQCPRKYYYQYIEKLPTLPSIHLIRGNIVHSVLEDFFKLDISGIPFDHYKENFMHFVMDRLNQLWEKNQDQLNKLGMLNQDLAFYFEESSIMIQIWISNFIKKLEKQMQKGKTLQEAFKLERPQTEIFHKSEKYQVQGYIDAVHKDDKGNIILVDYKTSKKDEMSEAYKLQLAIYAMMYSEAHGIIPKKVGINFLKFGERFIEVDDELIKLAKLECRLIQELTQEDHIDNYDKKTSPLCKWRTGQCDFYDTCFKKN